MAELHRVTSWINRDTVLVRIECPGGGDRGCKTYDLACCEGACDHDPEGTNLDLCPPWDDACGPAFDLDEVGTEGVRWPDELTLPAFGRFRWDGECWEFVPTEESHDG